METHFEFAQNVELAQNGSGFGDYSMPIRIGLRQRTLGLLNKPAFPIIALIKTDCVCKQRQIFLCIAFCAYGALPKRVLNSFSMVLSENSLNIATLQNFIFDLDGVIWRGHTPIEGAVESVRRLRAGGKRCFYCTNNSRLSQAQFAERLRAIGLELQDEDVISSAWATARFLATEMPRGFSVFVVGEEGLRATLQSIGARILDAEEAETQVADCVVAGIDREFNYEKMRLAQRQILHGARFIATNRDATFPVEDGVIPGSGSIIAGIETASGTAPTTIGKPEPLMLQLCVEAFYLAPAQTVMIGDRLDTDIACAHRAGLPAILVLTGVNTRADAENAGAEEKPDAIFDDLPALLRELF